MTSFTVSFARISVRKCLSNSQFCIFLKKNIISGVVKSAVKHQIHHEHLLKYLTATGKMRVTFNRIISKDHCLTTISQTKVFAVRVMSRLCVCVCARASACVCAHASPPSPPGYPAPLHRSGSAPLTISGIPGLRSSRRRLEIGGFSRMNLLVCYSKVREKTFFSVLTFGDIYSCIILFT